MKKIFKKRIRVRGVVYGFRFQISNIFFHHFVDEDYFAQEFIYDCFDDEMVDKEISIAYLIDCATGEEVTEFISLRILPAIDQAQLAIGDYVEFDATVTKYRTGVFPYYQYGFSLKKVANVVKVFLNAV